MSYNLVCPLKIILLAKLPTISKIYFLMSMKAFTASFNDRETFFCLCYLRNISNGRRYSAIKYILRYYKCALLNLWLMVHRIVDDINLFCCVAFL